MQYRVLGETGLKVSVLSYGASPLGSVFRPINEAEGRKAVHAALDLGINFIDVSPYYGLTKAETVLGQALKGVARGRYLLATKVGRYGAEFKDFDFSAGRVVKSVEESLGRLGVEYVDIIQCHDIEFGSLDQIVEETIPALRKVVKAGKARFVGITGLPMKVFREVVGRVKVDTVLSYCHYSLNDTALVGILPLMKEKGVGVINASPLSMGLLRNKGELPEWHPAPGELRAACRRAAELCKSRGVDLAKLAVQFAVGNPEIPTTLVGTASVEDITNNVKWAEERVDGGLMIEVREMLEGVHNVTWVSGHVENN